MRAPRETTPLPPYRHFLRGVAVGAAGLATCLALLHPGGMFGGGPYPVAMRALGEERPAERAGRLLNQTALNLEAMFHRELTEADGPAMLNGALSAIDPYGGYVAPEMARVLNGSPTDAEREANPYRVGLLGTPLEDRFVVETTAPGSPAERAGLKPGDRLIGVSGADLEGKDGKAAFAALIAAVESSGGSAIGVVVLRNSERMELSIVPEKMPPSYAYDLGTKGGVSHLALVGFYPGAAEGMKALIARAVSEGARGVVIDVRGNTGGRVDEAMATLALTAPKGTLAFVRDARGQAPEENRTRSEPEFPGVRVAVLINGQSASASEILAAALQANGLGLVVGETSYGKGSIQTVYPMEDPGGAIKMTIGFYRDPLGRVIDGVGVRPNVEIPALESSAARPDPEAPDPAFDAAAAWIRSGDPVPEPPGPRPVLAQGGR